MRVVLALVCVLTAGCGSDSSRGPPASPAGGGGSSGSGGATGGNAGQSSGGSSGSASGGSAGVGLDCEAEALGHLWQQFDGSYQMEPNAIAAGAEADFVSGQSYEIEVSRATCSLVFHGATQTYTCVWGTPGVLSKMDEHPTAGWLIAIGGPLEPTGGCQVDGFPDKVNLGWLYLPNAEYPTTFHVPPP